MCKKSLSILNKITNRLKDDQNHPFSIKYSKTAVSQRNGGSLSADLKTDFSLRNGSRNTA